MALTKSDRALVLVQTLKTQGDANLTWLYGFIEDSGVAVADSLLAWQYGKYIKLTGPAAQLPNLYNVMTGLHADSRVRAIDVILNLHGGFDQVYFDAGAVPAMQLQSMLAAAKNIGLSVANGQPKYCKYRALYSTLCFGFSHADNFVNAGFRVASGASAINTNAGVEYPAFLSAWGSGLSYGMALSLSFNLDSTIASDLVAEAMNMGDANSIKITVGNPNVTINNWGS
jgi:hypothetical protein